MSENQANLNSNDLQKAIEGLGRYYGTITVGTQAAAGVLDHLNDESLKPENLGAQGATLDAAKKIEGYPIVQSLVDISQGGKTTAKFLEAYKNYKASDGRDFSDKGYEPGHFIRVTCDGFVEEAAGEIDIINDNEWHEDEGVGIAKGEKIFSINRMLGLAPPEATSEEKMPSVNSMPRSPSKASPSLSVYQIFPAKMNIANRDTGAISVFLNAIPTIEMSRCVPVLDMVLISSRNPSVPSADGKHNRINTMSLGQFLLGNTALPAGSASDRIVNSIDGTALKGYVPPKPRGEKTEPDPNEPPQEPPIATAGMEMFTSPQTLVPGDETHMEFDDPQWQVKNSTADGGDDGNEVNLGPGGKRAAPVIDRFRPFLSILA